MSQLPVRPTIDARVRAAWQEQMAVAVKTPGLVPALLQRRQELLPRFATYYTQLCALPRRVRRALQRHCKHSLAGVALLFALGQEPVLAATITVSGGCSLIDAITAANTDTATGGCPAGSGADTIVLPAGSTLTLTTINNDTFGPTGLPVVSSVITIEGNNSTIQRESSDPDLFRIFAINGTGTLTLKDTAISGAFGDNRGGGVLNEGTLTLTNCAVSGGSAFPGNFGSGGGVFNAGSATITNSTISGNAFFGSGGGVFNAGSATITNSTISGGGNYNGCGGVSNSGTLTITGSKISGSAYGAGGGVCNFGTLTLTDSTISDSFVLRLGSRGGGVYNARYSTLTITSSTISGNGSEYIGGGISNNGAATITNSTISGNGTERDFPGVLYGGGVSNSGTLTITDSTLSGNSAFRGGGVLNDGTLTLVRTLVSGNTASNGPEIYNSLGGYFPGIVTADNFNLFGHDGSAGVSGFTPGATDVVPSVPLSDILDTTLADNGGPTLSHALVSGSPAIDAITTGCPPPDTDQRGFLRPADGDSIPGALCDIGAFEFNATPAVLEVTIDIKPGEFPNTINPKSNGVIPVAILSTPSFDATTVDPLSVEFGPQGALEAHGRGHREDVNGDGKSDLLLHFRTQETGIACGDTSVSLTGETFSGGLIQGADTIKTVGCQKP